VAQWLSWRWITNTADKKMTQEVGRIVVWLSMTFVFQIAVLLFGIIVFQEIAGAFLTAWGIVFMAVTIREILRLHRGNNLS
jgi:hypothetical protein